MIEISQVSRYYGAVKAVDDLSVCIQKGEIVGLLGPNGAGKTTTMRMISGFLDASEGSILIDGQDIRKDAKSIKRKIGYMPESAPLYSDMIVEDYLNYVAAIRSVDPAKKVPEIARTCGITEVMHKNISELSRGYRQRVGLAHALMNDPEILILDEPTSGLDPNQIIDVRNLIKEIGKTRTVIISTHILPEVEMLCDRVIIISRGKIVADSPTAELHKRFGRGAIIRIQADGCSQQELEQACSELEGLEACIPVQGEKNLAAVEVRTGADSEMRPKLFSLIKDRGWILFEMSLRQNSLEDVFRNLTSGGAA